MRSGWSPIPGDTRLAIIEEPTGEVRPAVWDLATEQRRSLDLGALRGPVVVEDWWPDASALLLSNLVEGQDHLYRFDIETEVLTPIPTPGGTISNARVRPDGTVWFRHVAGDSRPQVLDQDGRRVLEVEDEPAPPSRPYVSWHFDNPHGQRVHGFHVTPEGPGRFSRCQGYFSMRTLAKVCGGLMTERRTLRAVALLVRCSRGRVT